MIILIFPIRSKSRPNICAMCITERSWCIHFYVDFVPLNLDFFGVLWYTLRVYTMLLKGRD